MLWVYILRCADDSYYVGSTRDLPRRIWEHQEGLGAAYTRPPRRRPVTLMWSAEFASIRDGFAYEKRVQGWGRAKREALIEGREDLLPTLASRSWSTQQLKERLQDGDELPDRVKAAEPSTHFPWEEVEPAGDIEDPWAVRVREEGQWSRDRP